MEYPEYSDNHFQKKISSLKEFREHSLDEHLNLEKGIEELCKSNGISTRGLFEQQYLIRNFMNPKTFYTSLLLIHSVGLGKTLTAITVAESFPKVFILLEESVRLNFIGEYQKYYSSKIPSNFTIYTLGKMTRIINKLNEIEIKKMFSNSLIICDEIHNIRVQENTNEDNHFSRYDALSKLLCVSENTRLLLMSATPMFDSPLEITNIINLFILNELPSTSLKDIEKNLITSFQLFDNKLNFIGNDLLKKYLNGRISYIQSDIKTFPKKLYPSDSVYINGIDNIKLILCPLSKKQLIAYKEIQELNYRGDNYNMRIINNIAPTDEDLNENPLLIKNLSNKENSISSKFHKLYENLNNTPGPIFVYSEFLGESLEKITEMLSVNGWGNYNKNEKKEFNYILLQGNTSTKKRQELINVYNSNENKYGNIVKVILGSKVLKEGITLLNTRSVHIIEPWYNMSRLKQVEGRAIRSCSHASLPEHLRTVTTYLYCSTFGEIPNLSNITTIDKTYKNYPDIPFEIYNYYVSAYKENKILSVMKILREIAFDCNLHSIYNNNIKDNITCIDKKSEVINDELYKENKSFFDIPNITKIKNSIRNEILKNYVYIIPFKHDLFLSAIKELMLEDFVINKVNGRLKLIKEYLYFQPSDITWKSSINYNIDFHLQKRNKFPLSYFLRSNPSNPNPSNPNPSNPNPSNPNPSNPNPNPKVIGKYSFFYDDSGIFRFKNILKSSRTGKICEATKLDILHDIINEIEKTDNVIFPKTTNNKGTKLICKNVEEYIKNK